MEKTDPIITEPLASTHTQSKRLPRRRLGLSKVFWGLIGLVVAISIGIIVMAVVSMKQYTYEPPKAATTSSQEVEIINLGGNNSMVSGNQPPANPAVANESVVDSGSKAAEAAAADLVNQVTVKPVKPIKKQAAVAMDVTADTAANTPAKLKQEKAVQQKEANKQMDNLF